MNQRLTIPQVLIRKIQFDMQNRKSMIFWVVTLALIYLSSSCSHTDKSRSIAVTVGL
jgi:hypothetical protein